MKKRLILNQTLMSSIPSRYMQTFIELFMNTKAESAEHVTVKDFLIFIQKTDDVRGHTVSLFRRVMALIKDLLESEGKKKEAHLVLMSYPEIVQDIAA